MITPLVSSLRLCRSCGASFLQDMEREEELRTVPAWRAHQLVGDRKGVWSLSVTKNWRLTFRIDQREIEIVDLNYEDYH